jgi:glycosyltransferase involved in cell wall biosynthesis
MIVQLTKMAPGAGHGGVERVVGQIRQIFVETGIENEVWCFGDGSKQGEDRRGAIRAFKKSLSWHSTGISIRLGKRLLSLSDSRILVHEPTVGVLLPLLVPAVWRRFSNRGNSLTIWWHCDIVGRGLIGKISRSLQDVFLKRAERVIVSSPNLVGCCPQLSVVESNALTVIEFGTADPGPTVRSASSQLRLAFIGRLVWYKGIDVLLDAIKLVPVHLTIVGDGPMGSLLRDGTSFGESTIEWLPNADDATCREVLLSSEALVLPSTSNAEAFGLVLIEAMAAGLPLITSDLATGVTHINRDGETGLRFPVGDHKALAERIGQLSENHSLREKLAKGARKSFEHTYSEAKFRSRILEEFQ